MNIDLLQIRNDKISQFNKKGIYTIEDLVNFMPRKYYDFTSPDYIMYLEPDEMQATIGTIQGINLTEKYLQFDVMDDKGWHVYVTFFHMDYLARQFVEGDRVLVCGVIKQGHFKTMVNPLVFTTKIEENERIYPIYSAIKGMSSQFLEDKMKKAIQLLDKEDFLEPTLQKKYGVVTNYEAYKMLHFPKTMADIQKAKKRLLLNDLFLFNYHMKEMENEYISETNIKITTIEKTKELMKSLPFPLTTGNFNENKFGQKDVLNDLVIDMMDGKRVNALVQGDVGCGKTIVALLLSLVVVENGYQSVILAPTGVLAHQHYEEFSKYLEPLGIKIGFLASDVKKSEQNKIIKAVNNGEIDVLVGTHSVLNDKIEYKNLGLAVCDEEHKFGVKERQKLGFSNVHKISMSATPIPRSLALSLYGGSIKTEIINVLPAGRKQSITKVVLPSEKNKVYYKILEELEKNRQCYIVCPLKDESNSDKLTDVADVKSEYREACAYFEKHGFKVGMATGATKKSEVEKNLQVLNDFKEHRYDVIVCTTLIEVGVSVPNANCILVINSERFGYSQLHQLKGRCKRSSYQPYCFLMTDNKEKFKIFEQTDDGFKIAEEDLKLRGAGSFLGTEQSGENKYLMLIMANPKLNEYIKKDIDEIFKSEDRKKRYYNLIDIEEV